MGDGTTRTSLLAPDVSGTAHRLALSADILNVLVMFLPYRNYFVVIVIDYDFQDIFGARLYAFATSVALIAVDNNVPVSRAIGVAIIGNVAGHYP